MMYRMLFALPVALLARTAANGRLRKLTPCTKDANVDEERSSEAAIAMKSSDVTNDSQTAGSLEQLVRVEKKCRVDPRYTLEDDDFIRESLRCKVPPVGEATLNSGLSVEIASW